MRNIVASQFETDRAYKQARREEKKETRQRRDERRSGKRSRWEEKE